MHFVRLRSQHLQRQNLECQFWLCSRGHLHRDRFNYKKRVRKPVQSKGLKASRFLFGLDMPDDWHEECHAHFDQWTPAIPLRDNVREPLDGAKKCVKYTSRRGNCRVEWVLEQAVLVASLETL